MTTAAPPQKSRTAGGPSSAAPSTRTLRIGLFGCPLDTGNAGVSALGLSTVKGILGAGRAEFTIFDYGSGTRRAALAVGHDSVSVRMMGVYNSRRYYRLTNLTQMLVAARLGLGLLHPVCRDLLSLDAILDISGGDSFADLYGQRRFTDVTLPKLVAVRLGVPLVLLPQTYGPYRDPRNRAAASTIVRAAQQCWARDEHSYAVLRDLLGDAFNPDRHRTGVDVAFGLPVVRPNDAAADAVDEFAGRHAVTVGLNVSGLLYNRPGDDVERYGFRSSYRSLVDGVIQQLLEIDGLGIVLVPHVAPLRPMVDDDAAACESVVAALGRSNSGRVLPLPRALSAPELKWCIGRCEWFCGTRMHSTIGAISQGVPTTAVAYSDKTLGVFATAGVAECVVDPRTSDGPEVVSRILQGFANRDRAAGMLGAALPGLRRRLDEQFRAIVGGLSP